MNKWGIFSLIIVIILCSSVLLVNNVIACKDIVACGNSTAGDYNLLLKVRDPSRPGLQVLTIIPEGYEYDYHHPWSGKKMSFTTDHKYIGICTKGDTIPNIVKSGMSLSETGIAYGDADTNSKRINPSRNAWDDFDWIRYACEKANTEEEAVDLLTKEAVDELHATGVSENLFVVGPKTGYIIEANAFQYNIKEIDEGIAVMSNYPKALWKTHRIDLFPISNTFDRVVEKNVRRFSTVRLGSIFGIRITNIGANEISAKPISIFHAKRSNSLGVVTKIQVGDRENVGLFSVQVLDINGRSAKVRVTNKYKAWEEELLGQINNKIDGKISVEDMMYFSRFDRDDLNGLRPMCEDFFKYEAVAIYRIPSRYYDILSLGWFSPNHACSSIYVPFHICNNDIYTPYKTGDAARISLELFNIYDPNVLASNFSRVERIFSNEINELEEISIEYIVNDTDVSEFFTIIDSSMQKQAYLTEEIWIEIDKSSNRGKLAGVIQNIWEEDYITTLENIEIALENTDKISYPKIVRQRIIDISFDICESRINAAGALGKNIDYLFDKYSDACNQVMVGNYDSGFRNLRQSFIGANNLIKGQEEGIQVFSENEEFDTDNAFLYFLLVILAIVFLLVFSRFKINFE